jgi:peptide/nickel transport system permease protein
MSVTNAIKKASPPPSRQSQWALVAREFRKRRLAVAAAVVVMGLVTISVFAPLLANDRPIYFTGINRFEFREAARTLRGIIGQISISSELPSDAGKEAKAAHSKKFDDQIRSVRLQFELMSEQLPADASAGLHAFQERIVTAAAGTNRTKAADELRTVQRELRPLLESMETKLIVRSHWPVFKSLSWSDLGFMSATLLLLAFPLWGRWATSRQALIAFCLVPAVSAVVWWWLVPPRVDRTDYKSGLLAADDAAQKAAVSYRSVMWPPIAYALDENDLVGRSIAPAWYPEAWRPQPIERPNSPEGESSKKPPSRWNTPHWMGTDGLGRDVLCRMIWGGRVSLSVGIVAVAIYVVIGIVIGSVAGYFRGVCDLVLSRIIEVVICFPSFFLILTIVAMRGPGLINIMVVIGLTSWTGIARLVRGEFLRLVDQEFVMAGKALGYSPLRLIFRHVLPNAMAPVLVSATFGIAGAILTESALSFLGVGIQKPTTSWGSLLAEGRSDMEHAPWLIHFPGLAIFITITAYNLIGEALRDAADPRLRGSR